jgi:glycosyltransferase involved in cell wall biosynthesis
MPTYHFPHFCQPTIVAVKALIAWNAYLATGGNQHREAFLSQAAWLLEHATAFEEELSGWPVLTRLATLSEPAPLLSASTQGLALSVLARAYRLTNDTAYLQTAQRAARAFELDIFDGGVCAPVGSEGLFFEEVAAYPAAHHLSACLIALRGLYDYLAVTDDAQIAALVQRCLAALSALAPLFDTGYWSRADLASRRLADAATHALHIVLLKTLAHASGDAAWASLAERWVRYQHSPRARLRCWLASKAGRVRERLGVWIRRGFWRGAGAARQSDQQTSELEDKRKDKLRVCVPITAFPLPGGIRTVLAGVAQATADEWNMEYLTRHVGPNPDCLTIWSFSKTLTVPAGFPNVWLYVLAGWWRLLVLLRQRRYQVVISQDGLYTGTFAALAARMAGIRVVCMDHGTIKLPYSASYRAQRIEAIASAPWPLRLLLRFRVACYLLSLRLLASLSTRFTDFFLPASGDVEETYRQRWGVTPDRALVYPFLMDTGRYAPCDAQVRAERRAALHLPADAVVIAMVNRLEAEKSITTALQGVSRVLQRLPAETASRVRLVIAGDGSLRKQIEQEIRQRHLESVCLLLGVATPDEVASLLSISDLFLYTAIRGINSAAVQEAMATGLPVIASLEPRAAAALLADGRGLAFPASDVEALTLTLEEVLRDPLRARQMGALARTYIETHHRAEILRRCLLRATGWPLAESHVKLASREDHLRVTEQAMS